MTTLHPPNKCARAALGIVCALLLFAQQVGLAHSVWHASQQLPQQTQGVQQTLGGKSPALPHASRLCPLDAALGQVLGGAFTTAFSFDAAATGAAAPSWAHSELASHDRLTPRSRGPPLFS